MHVNTAAVHGLGLRDGLSANKHAINASQDSTNAHNRRPNIIRCRSYVLSVLSREIWVVKLRKICHYPQSCELLKGPCACVKRVCWPWYSVFQPITTIRKCELELEFKRNKLIRKLRVRFANCNETMYATCCAKRRYSVVSLLRKSLFTLTHRSPSDNFPLFTKLSINPSNATLLQQFTLSVGTTQSASNLRTKKTQNLKKISKNKKNL